MEFGNYGRVKSIMSTITTVEAKTAAVMDLDFEEPGANGLVIADDDRINVYLPKELIGEGTAKHIQDEVLQALGRKKESLLSELKEL